MFNQVFGTAMRTKCAPSYALNFDNVVYSYDIQSLYTSISIDLGIEAIGYWQRNLISE